MLKDAPDTTAAQVASPRQNVLADADVPEFKLVTGKLPVTFDVRLANVVEVVPVPPEAMGKAEPSVKEVK